MSKTITDEKIKLSIIIDGNNAQKELIDLEKATRKLTEENKSLNLQKKLLESQGKKESAQWQNVTAEIKKNTLEITQNKTKMAQLQNEIGLTGLTMNQLNQKALVLRMTLKNLIPGSADYQKYKAELGQVTARIGELSGKAQQSKFSLGSIADGFNKYQGLALSFAATLTGVVLSIQKIIDINGKLTDAQADVMKTTGMNKKEVDELTKSFGMLETRTSRIDLLKIAEQGGRIGIMKDDIGGFVDVMNKATVSLGDSFTGGAEEVANKLGKIKFLFAETKDLGVDKAYNAIGSAINDLGANGVASEANIAEFTTRIGSLTDVLKPSIQETLALGTAFEESGIEAEVSARAYNIFMKQASTESAKFAKVMGISQKSVENMINTNPLDFMMKFAEGMRGMDATHTAKTLDYLGVNADGANKVIGAMGNNIGRFRELIDLSNNSFATGTSLIKEYDIKNQTLGATLEKISKKVAGWFSSEAFTNWLATAAIWFAKFIGATEDADSSVAKWRSGLAFTAKIIAVVISSMISYGATSRVVAALTKENAIAMALFNLQNKLQVFWNSLQVAGLTIYTGVMNFFGITTNRATASLLALNRASMLSPWGALAAVVTAVAVAYFVFSESAKKAATATETFAKQQKDLADSVAKSTADTKANLASLISLVKDESVSMATRKRAYEDLVKISPIFNGYLKDEKFNIEGLLIAYSDYLKALDQVAYARQFNKLNESNIKNQIAAEQELFNAEVKRQAEQKKFEKAKAEANKAGYNNEGLRDGLDKAEAAVAAAKANLENTKSLVVATNDFRSSEIAKLEASIALRQLQIKKLEDKYGVEVFAKTSRFRQLTLQLEADKKALEAMIGKQIIASGKSDFNPINPNDQKGTGKKDPNSSAEDIRKLNYENEAKYGEMSLKLQREIEDARFAALEEGYFKEMQIENDRYVRRMQDLEKQKVHDDEFIKLDAEIAKAKADGDTTKYNALLQIKEGWKQKNTALDLQINELELSEIALHNKKVAIIEENAANEALKKNDEKFRREKVIRETNFNEQLAQITSVEQAKILLKDSLSKREIDKITTLDEAKKALQEDFNTKEQKREIDYLNALLENLDQIINSKEFEGINLDLLTPEAKDRWQKQIENAKKLKSELDKAIADKPGNNAADYERKNEEDKQQFQKLNGGTDILGYTPEQWEEAYNHLDTFWGRMSAGIMVVGAIQKAWGAYNNVLEQNESARLKSYDKTADKRKKILKKQLDSGLISQNQYNKALETIDNQVEKKKAEIEYKQAKRKKTMSIVDTIINTAVAIMQGYSQLGPIGGSIAAVVIGTLGALQIAAISKQPLPAKGYEDGLYPEYVKREQDGKIFKPSSSGKMKTGLYSKPTFLVGEGPGDMPEMIIDKKAYASLSPGTKDVLLRELRGVKGFEQGYYNENLKRYEVQSPSKNVGGQSIDSDMFRMMYDLVARNTMALEDLRDNGVVGKFFENDYNSINKIKKGIKTLDDLKSKAKK